MNLILHHLAKDIRAQRWLLLLWVFFILGYLGADLLIIQPSYGIAHVGDLVLASPLLSVGSSVVWTLLIVGLIQSEPVTGSNSFWLTRPIPRWVLIPSKLTFLVVFLIVPWLAIAPCEMLLLKVDHALFWKSLLPVWWTIALTIGVVWITTFTRSLGGFFAVAALIIPGAALIFGGFEIYRINHLSAAGLGVDATQTSLLVYILLAGLVVSIFVQQVIRKTRLGIRIALGSVVLALLAGFFWPVALPTRWTLLSFLTTGNADLIAQKNVQVDFAPGWPESLMWSQPNNPNGATKTVAVANGATLNATIAKPISTTDDEGNPVIIGAVVASAQLTPVTSNTPGFPIIEGVEASFKPINESAHELPRRDSDVFSDKSRQFDLVKALQGDLPGTTITTSTGGDSTLAPTPLFKLDAENLDHLRGKTGDLMLRLYGHQQSLARQAAIPLDGDASSRMPNGMAHAYFTTRQTQSIFGIDLPIATEDKPMLAVWQIAYQPALSLFQTENYYILIDTTTHTGVILASASTFPHRAASFSSRASWTEYLTLPFDATSEGALTHKVLYIYTSTPEAFFNATLTAPGFTMSPP